MYKYMIKIIIKLITIWIGLNRNNAYKLSFVFIFQCEIAKNMRITYLKKFMKYCYKFLVVYKLNDIIILNIRTLFYTRTQ